MTDDLISREAALECCNEMLRKSKPLEKSTSAIELRRAIAALPAAQVQAEPVAQEPVAWRVYGMMRQGATNNVKARGIGSDPTEYLYPVHREADARECARLMRGEVQPLYSHPATTPPAPDDLDALVQAAHGLSFGHDWNNGTHAKTHGYRAQLLGAIGRIMGRRASPEAALVASEPAPGSHQPPLPSEDAQGGEV